MLKQIIRLLGLPKKTYRNWLTKLDLYLSKKLEEKFLSKQLKFAENSRGWFLTLILGRKQQLYSGIDDMSILNWYHLCKGGDLTMLYLNKPKSKKLPVLFLKYQWKKIHNELIDSQEISDEEKLFYSIKIKIQKLEIDEILKGRNLKTLIDIEKYKLTEIANKNNSGKDYFFPNKIAIEEHILKGQMDLRKTSIREFHEYINELKRRK